MTIAIPLAGVVIAPACSDEILLLCAHAAKRHRFRKFALRIRFQNANHLEDEASVSTTAHNAIWDSLRDSSGPQWPKPASRDDPVSVPLSLHVHRDTAILYRDMSGVSLLHRNMVDTTTIGSDVAKAKEGMAAAVLTMAGWNHMVPGFGEANKNDAQGKDRVLLDPFCGTGTFLVQAALMALNVAPGLMRRRWPFQVCALVCIVFVPFALYWQLQADGIAYCSAFAMMKLLFFAYIAIWHVP